MWWIVLWIVVWIVLVLCGEGEVFGWRVQGFSRFTGFGFTGFGAYSSANELSRSQTAIYPLNVLAFGDMSWMGGAILS